VSAGQLTDRLARYVIDRLRQHSAILEPEPRLDPYRAWGPNPLHDPIRRLNDCGPRGLLRQLDEELRGLGKRREPDNEDRLIQAALTREDIGRETAGRLLDMVRERLGDEDVSERAKSSYWRELHEAALGAACRHETRDEFLALLSVFTDAVRAASGPIELTRLFRDHVRTLFRLGLLEEADQFLQATADALPGGLPREQWLAGDEAPALYRLRTLLALANGWYAFGWSALADPVLECALTWIAHPGTGLSDRGRLARELGESVWVAERGLAGDRLAWLLGEMPSLRDNFSSAPHYSLHVLDFTESLVATAVEVCTRR
jgi:hypothetical protein